MLRFEPPKSGAFACVEEVAKNAVPEGCVAAARDGYAQSQSRQQNFMALQSYCNIGDEGWPGSFKPSRRQP
jgi:hypothetical protein